MRKLVVLVAGLAAFASLHATSGISGFVTDADNGLPIRNARACCRAESSRAYSDSIGSYLISPLSPGTYTVTISASGYVRDTYPDPVVVVPEQVTSNISFALHRIPTGGISGRVVNAESQQPIPNAYVYAVGTDYHAYCDSNGYYEMGGMLVGKYLLHARAAWFVYQTYPESVPVVANQVTPNINFALVPAGAISGCVTSASTHLPIRSATVYASGPHGSAYVTTDTLGRYSISMQLAAGRYRVRASASGYQTGYYPDSVLVIAGRATEHIDLALVISGGISGRVTNLQTGAPIVHATVACSGLPNAYTDNNGAYLVAANPGRYTVWASCDGYLNGIYPESILVQPGAVRESINFALIPISGLTGIGGRLTDARRMVGIGGGTVRASGPNGGGTATSIRTGGYLISPLPAGRYWVVAEAQGFQTMAGPESVTVVEGQVRWAPFYMTPNTGPTGAISGRVTNSQNGQVIGGAEVRAFGPNGHAGVVQGTYGYVISQLAPGKCWVSASASGFADGHYPDSVVVTAGDTIEHVDFQLQPTGQVGRLTGHVTNAESGELIVNARVYATNPHAGYQVLQGLQDYHFYLPPGKYWVSAGAEGFEPGHYPDSVTVVAGQNTEHIDFVLHSSGGTTGGISGTVTNAQNGAPIFVPWSWPPVRARVTRTPKPRGLMSSEAFRPAPIWSWPAPAGSSLRPGIP